METVTSTFHSYYKTKNSKFIGYLAPCTHSGKLEAVLEGIKNEHPRASHHCYAYRINPEKPLEFSTDDGEPNGTAGAPILNLLKSGKLVNILCVVVRYYGGTNLGKSGLIGAYSQTASLAIDAAKMKKVVAVCCYRVVYSYDQQSIIDSLKHRFEFTEIESKYLEHVSLTFAIPEKNSDLFESHAGQSVYLFKKFKKLGRSYRLAQ